MPTVKVVKPRVTSTNQFSIPTRRPRAAAIASATGRRPHREDVAEEGRDPGLKSGRAALPRSGHVEPRDVLLLDPGRQLGGRRRPHVEEEDGPALPPGQALRQRRPAIDPALMEDDGAVGVADIPGRALRILGGRSLTQRIAVGDGPVFGAPSARTPAAAGNACGQGGVEGAPIRARLSAADDEEEVRACGLGKAGQRKLAERVGFEPTIPFRV